MPHLRALLAVIGAATLCVACAATPPAAAGSVEMRLLPGQSPVADVDGPYAAYSRVGHGVVLRVWPDSIRDGMVDMSIIVRNTDPEAIQLSTADVAAATDAGALVILGEQEALARFDAGAARGRRNSSALAIFDRPIGGDTGEYEGIGQAFPSPGTYSVSRVGSRNEDSEDERQQQRAELAEWYLDTVDIAPGATAVSGVSMQLPDTSQTIIVRVVLNSEEHEFAVLYER